MTVKEIKEIAKKWNIDTRKMKKADIIHAIQDAEGNPQCYQTGMVDCPQTECLWYKDCQK